jgi:hypothetical protein
MPPVLIENDAAGLILKTKMLALIEDTGVDRIYAACQT